MNLQETIKQQYFELLHVLPVEKRFHFASRLAAWRGGSEFLEILKSLRTYMLPDDSFDGQIKTLSEILNAPQTVKPNAAELRQPFFEQYPVIRPLNNSMFRLRHLKEVYGVDSTKAFLKIVEKENLDKLAQQIRSDDIALRILSTYAINFLFLYSQYIQTDNKFIDPARIERISREYDLSDKRHIQLMIYLFTHCIINETNLYTKHVKAELLPAYLEMLGKLETVIEQNFQLINLDNKLEFLVSCRICGYDSFLFEKIFNECRQSLSHDGHFLVDKHNANPQQDKMDIVNSEHRNVLFIMSTSPYYPHSTLVSQ